MKFNSSTAYVLMFTTNNSTGAAADADTTPTVSVRANGTEIVASASVTVAKLGSEDGVYTASFTTPAGLTEGQIIGLLIKATIGGVAAKAAIDKGVVDKLTASLNDPTASECKADLTTLEGRLTPERAGYLDNLDVSGKVASAGGLSAVNSNLSNINSVKLPAIDGKIDVIDGLVDGIVAELDTTPLATLAKPGDSMVAANMVSEPPSEASIAAAVWAHTTRTLSNFGSLVSSIWSSTTRTLTAGTKDTEIEAIKAKTDSLNFIGTDVKSVASNMRGTDNALLAANYTSPDNTGIAAAQTAAESADGKLPADTTAKLANLDATISSRLADADYTSPPSEASIASAVWNYATSLMTTAGSIGLKLKEWVVGKITSIDDTVDFTSVQKTSLNAATPSVTINDKTGFSLTSEYDPAKTAAQVSDTETIQTVVEFIKDVNEGDCFIDQTTTPFQMVVHKKGDPTTEFIRKDLLDQNGDGITDLTTHTIYQREPS